MAGNKNSGGARRGSGPVRVRFTLAGPAAIYVRQFTRSQLNRRDVTAEELNEALRQIVEFHAQNLSNPLMSDETPQSS